MRIKPAKKWTRVKWHGNLDEPFASWECWQLGYIVLYPGQWLNDGWSYVASYGANSERSHSGFLKGFITLESAKAEIERLLLKGEI